MPGAFPTIRLPGQIIGQQNLVQGNNFGVILNSLTAQICQNCVSLNSSISSLHTEVRRLIEKQKEAERTIKELQKQNQLLSR